MFAYFSIIVIKLNKCYNYTSIILAVKKYSENNFICLELHKEP